MKMDFGNSDITSALWYRVGIVVFVVAIGAVKARIDDGPWILLLIASSLLALAGAVLPTIANRSNNSTEKLKLVGHVIFSMGIVAIALLILIAWSDH